ncbi:MAG: hypothetical protein H7175_05515 [Burkholderiales bacterium]|nr:hypothetical protein [Anaerolineae bacterium]
MTYQVLSPDNAHARALDVFANIEGIQLTAGSFKRDQVLSMLAETDAIILRSATTVDAELLNAAPKLKVIARAGVGVDNVDLDVATARGIIVMNTPDGNTIATAEHTFGLMLALARHIPQAYGSMQQGKWERKSFMGVELRGKTLGIVGFGRIGRAVAKRALAFEMTVVAYDPYIPADVAADLGVELVDLDTLYSRADFIALHSLVTDETRYMVNAESIAKMKAGVRIVNAARGLLINDDDLAAAIKSGYVAGAAVDVYAEEPPPDNHPLVGLAGVIHTPHLAASTDDAQISVSVEAAQLVVDALLKGEYKNVVNPAALTIG